MTADLMPYPAMKDSGVPWLGKVPEHWAVLRLRNAAEMRVSNVDKHTKDDEQPVRLCNYVDVYKNDRIRERMTFMRATATSEEIERFRLETGDVLITKDSETWNDIGVPALVEEPADDLICGYHLALLRPLHDRLSGDYLFRALQSTAVSYQFHVEANGVTRYGLSHAAIKSIWLPLPPLLEQAAIVRFLDHADRRIQRYIRAKQKLIKLLEEQKQAIIHRAVTRGLDPNVRLKPSGVEWLGDVPDGWGILKLGRVAKVFNGTTPSRMQPIYWAGGTVPWMASGKVNDFVVETPTEWVTERAVRDCSLRLVPKGSVILGLVGQGKTRGLSAVLGIDACINQNLAAIVPRVALDGRFLHLWLIAHYNSIRDLGRGGNQEALNCEIVSNLRVSVPPPEVQAAIVQAVHQATLMGNRAIGAAAREISLLREYRTRLIAGVVTGKLDVRAAAARLPDDADESEPLDETDPITDAEEGMADDLDAALEAAEA